MPQTGPGVSSSSSRRRQVDRGTQLGCSSTGRTIRPSARLGLELRFYLVGRVGLAGDPSRMTQRHCVNEPLSCRWATRRPAARRGRVRQVADAVDRALTAQVAGCDRGTRLIPGPIGSTATHRHIEVEAQQPRRPCFSYGVSAGSAAAGEGRPHERRWAHQSGPTALRQPGAAT